MTECTDGDNPLGASMTTPNLPAGASTTMNCSVEDSLLGLYCFSKDVSSMNCSSSVISSSSSAWSWFSFVPVPVAPVVETDWAVPTPPYAPV